jgi:bacillithiol biosynthesis cysteine-adding enzyme BshC
VSIRVVSTPLTGSSLSRVFLEGHDTRWFVPGPKGGAAWRARAGEVRKSLLHHDWFGHISPAFGENPPERLLRAVESGFIVTAGQQPGLFGGPLYTWWKALSALALADELEKSTGMPVAPVFWAATDDSDFVEASSTTVSTPDGAIRIEMPPRENSGIPLAQVRLGDISRELSLLEAATGSAPASGVLEMVKSSYVPDATVGSAYVSLLRTVLEPMGIGVLDASDKSVRSAAHPILAKALELSDDIESALAYRADEVEAEGHAVQVKSVHGRSLVFAEADGKRERVRARHAAEVAAGAEPGSLGPNVLLRPIVERSILPTVAYLGGPAEIAYFAQVTAVASTLSVMPPLGLPRWSGFVVEPRVERILERHGLEIEDFRDPHAVETRLARTSLPENLAANLASLRQSLERAAADLSRADDSDLVSPNVLQGFERNILHRLDRLERRFSAGVKRRGNDVLREAAIARGALFPFGKPQERALNIIPLLARYGDELMASVLREVRLHATSLA